MNRGEGKDADGRKVPGGKNMGSNREEEGEPCRKEKGTVVHTVELINLHWKMTSVCLE